MDPGILQAAVLGLVLSADASAYAFSYGLILRYRRTCAALQLATVTALFQAGMPLLGYAAGVGLLSLIGNLGKWFTCCIFCALGVSCFVRRSEDTISEPLGISGLLLVAVATSIDAFAVGVGFALRAVSLRGMVCSVVCIGAVTYAAVTIGFFLSAFFTRFPERMLQVAAGSILILFGAMCLL